MLLLFCCCSAAGMDAQAVTSLTFQPLCIGGFSDPWLRVRVLR